MYHKSICLFILFILIPNFCFSKDEVWIDHSYFKDVQRSSIKETYDKQANSFTALTIDYSKNKIKLSFNFHESVFIKFNSDINKIDQTDYLDSIHIMNDTLYIQKAGSSRRFVKLQCDQKNLYSCVNQNLKNKLFELPFCSDDSTFKISDKQFKTPKHGLQNFSLNLDYTEKIEKDLIAVVDSNGQIIQEYGFIIDYYQLYLLEWFEGPHEFGDTLSVLNAQKSCF